MGRNYLEGKPWGPEERPIDSGRYELPAAEKDNAGNRQDQKNWQHKAKLDKRMKWIRTAAVHRRIKVGIAGYTISWAQCDRRNTGCKNTYNDNQNKMFSGDIHKLRFITLRCFEINLNASPLYPHCGIKSRDLFQDSSSLCSICRGTMVSFELECIPRIIKICPKGQRSCTA